MTADLLNFDPTDTRQASQPVSPPTKSGRLRTWLLAAKVIVSLLAVVVISGAIYVLGLFILRPDLGEEFTVGLRPNQFYSAIDPDARMFAPEAYGVVWGVAHNSGASTDAILDALVNGADFIEVDVVEVDGRLRAAHTAPLPIVGSRLFRGPTLDRVWTASYQADARMLDLKESTPAYVNLVIEFLNSHPTSEPVLVSSRDAWVLRSIRIGAPHALLLLSVPDEATLNRIQHSEALIDLIDGITVRHTALTPESATWLQMEGLLVFAWTVNDIDRVNELMTLGVDGITSDNLAIVTLLGGQARGERDLPEAKSP